MMSYGMPISPLRPADTWFNTRLGPGVPAWWSPSGHLLVKPLVNGQVAGFMILDTGGLLTLSLEQPTQIIRFFGD